MSKNDIIYKAWRSSGAKCAIILVHGFGAHKMRWRAFAEFFLEKNISSYAIDLKGFGENAEEKGHIDSFNTYLEDILTLRERILEEAPGTEIFLAGESMGALISFLLAAKNPAPFKGLICLSPAFRVALKFSVSKYIEIFFSLFFFPRKKIDAPFAAELLTRDAHYQKLLEKDEKEIRFATAKFFCAFSMAQRRAKFASGKINLPILFLLAGRDAMVSTKASKKIFDRIASPDKKMIVYPEMRHALSIELGREKVFEDIAEWIQNKI